MGSLCCVAARPRGSNGTERELRVGPCEPYWRTNTSFSPLPPRWDYSFQSEGPQLGSDDSIQLFGSTSSNSLESRSWLSAGSHTNHQDSASESGVLFSSSPSDTSQIQSWVPPPLQGMNMDDFEASLKRDQSSGYLSFTPAVEGTSMVLDGRGSISSHSDGSEFNHIGKQLLSTSTQNFSTRRSFHSKPIHPLSFPDQALTREASASPASRFAQYHATRHRYTHRMSTGSSSVDLTDISHPYEPDFLTQPSNSDKVFKCELCDRSLSHRSPWSSRRIVKTGDLPVTGVLSCSHVFHAECLDQATPKSHTIDPLCPICSKPEGEDSLDHHTLPKLRNAFPRHRPCTEEGQSRNWGFVQAGHDCIDSALHTPRSSLLLMNRNRVKKNASPEGILRKDFSGRARKTGSYPLHFLGGKFVNGYSKAAAGPSIE